MPDLNDVIARTERLAVLRRHRSEVAEKWPIVEGA